ncbi:hypothetical protein MKX03_018618, partial [Papaver bracteatum]
VCGGGISEVYCKNVQRRDGKLTAEIGNYDNVCVSFAAKIGAEVVGPCSGQKIHFSQTDPVERSLL